MQMELIAAPRTEKGKKATKKLRQEGRIPAVLYGHGFETMEISLQERSFKTLIRQAKGLHGLMNLKVEGDNESKHTVLVKELQRHPIKDHILHVDFQKVRSGEELQAQVTLHFTGEPAGVKEGGILQHYLYEITVQCLPKDLPEEIGVDISGLELKENLRVSDLLQIEGVKYVNNPEEIVVAVAPKRVHEEIAPELEEGLEEGEEAVAPEEEAEGEEAAAPSEEENE